MAFQEGQLIECIDGDWQPRDPMPDDHAVFRPRLHHIYRVKGVVVFRREQWLRLQEGTPGICYHSRGFRPLTDERLALFRAALQPAGAADVFVRSLDIACTIKA